LNVFGVKFGGIVHIQNILRQLIIRLKVIAADEAFWVEKVLHPRISPVDWNRVHMEGVDDLLCTPTSAAGVFEGEVEAIAGKPINLHLVAVTRR
jgi:hypothetical protein